MCIVMARVQSCAVLNEGYYVRVNGGFFVRACEGNKIRH